MQSSEFVKMFEANLDLNEEKQRVSKVAEELIQEMFDDEGPFVLLPSSLVSVEEMGIEQIASISAEFGVSNACTGSMLGLLAEVFFLILILCNVPASVSGKISKLLSNKVGQTQQRCLR